jgi:hypothetical protein
MAKQSKFRPPPRVNLPPTHDVPETIDYEELCRRVISDPTVAPLDKFRAMDRLREIERERQASPEPPSNEEYDDLAKLQKTLELFVEHRIFDQLPAFQEIVEARAEVLIEERARAARAAFAVVDEDRSFEPGR